MKSETVQRWLSDIGKDRVWLAAQLEKSIGTINNWFSQGFPKNSQAAIQLLMANASSGEEGGTTLTLPLSWNELESIHEAAARNGMGLREFVISAVNSKSDDLALVAESSEDYSAKTKK